MDFRNVQLIYPHQKDAETRDKIFKYITDYHSVRDEYGIVTFLDDTGNKYLKRRQLENLNETYKLYESEWDQCLMKPDMIIAMYDS